MVILPITTDRNFIVYLCYMKLIISHIIIYNDKLTAIRCIEDAIISHRKQMVTGEVYPDNLTPHEPKLDWPNNIFKEPFSLSIHYVICIQTVNHLQVFIRKVYHLV